MCSGKLYIYQSIKTALRKKPSITLLEIMITLGLFTVFVVGVSELLRIEIRAREKYYRKIIATNLAKSLMAEIRVKDFEETIFGAEPGENRTGANPYDDVDDYNGLNDTPPRDLRGNIIGGSSSDYANFTRNATVIYVDENNTPTGGVPSDYKRVSIIVTHPSIPNVILEEIRANLTQ